MFVECVWCVEAVFAVFEMMGVQTEREGSSLCKSGVRAAQASHRPGISQVKNVFGAR